MKNLFGLLMVLLLSSSLAQNSNVTVGEPYTVTDGLGREMTLEAPPERVAALANGPYGHMASLGVVPSAVLANPEMINDTETYLEEGPDIFWVGGDPWWEVDAELVAVHAPDLIITIRQQHVDLLSGIAPVFVVPGVSEEATGEPLAYSELRAVGAALGRPEDADTVIENFEQLIEAYAAMVPEQPTTLKMMQSANGGFAFSAVADPLCAHLLDRIVTCEWPQPPGVTDWDYPGTLEVALALDPDVIVLANNSSTQSHDEFLAMLDADPLWNEVAAVKNDRVLFFPDYRNPIFSSVASGRKFLDTVMPAMFPGVFPEPLTDEQVQEILANQ
ncbi:MAG: ABC transporter substrate-binding protein [Deinococcota bacterium]